MAFRQIQPASRAALMVLVFLLAGCAAREDATTNDPPVEPPAGPEPLRFNATSITGWVPQELSSVEGVDFELPDLGHDTLFANVTIHPDIVDGIYGTHFLRITLTDPGGRSQVAMLDFWGGVEAAGIRPVTQHSFVVQTPAPGTYNLLVAPSRGAITMPYDASFHAVSQSAPPPAVAEQTSLAQLLRPSGESPAGPATVSAWTFEWTWLMAGLAALMPGVAWLRKSTWFSAALFTRIQRDRLLDHPRRAAIEGHVRNHPGATFAELRAALGISSGAVAHHVALLRRASILRARSDGRRERFWTQEQRVTPPTGQHPRAALLEAIRSRPGASVMQLARSVGLSRQNATYHLQILQQKGHVTRQQAGRKVRHFPAT